MTLAVQHHVIQLQIPAGGKTPRLIHQSALNSTNKTESECDIMSFYLQQTKKPHPANDRRRTVRDVTFLPVDYSLLMEEEEADGDLSGVESGQTRSET